MSLEQAIIQTTDSLKEFQRDFNKFFTSNFLFIVIAAAVCIGFATKDMISNVMNDGILPIINLFIHNTIPYFVYSTSVDMSKKYYILNILIRKCGKIIWLVIVWILTLYLTFIVFSSLSRIDFLTKQANLIQAITRYVKGEGKTRQETMQETMQEAIYKTTYPLYP